MKRNAQGFTLIELLIVIAIIAILALIAIPNFLEAQTRAKVTKTMANMRTLATALEAFHVDHNCYPPVFGGHYADWYDALWCPTAVPAAFGFKASLTTPVSYITTAVQDPFMVNYIEQKFFKPCDIAWHYGVDYTATAGWMLQSRGPSLTANKLWAQTTDGYSVTPSKTDKDCFAYVFATYGVGPTLQFITAGDKTLGFIGGYDPTNGTISSGNIYRTNVGAR